MTNKTRELYDAVLAKLLSVYNNRFPEAPLHIQHVMSDYEAAIQGSLKFAFPDCTVTGCSFHFAQVYAVPIIFINYYKIYHSILF